MESSGRSRTLEGFYSRKYIVDHALVLGGPRKARLMDEEKALTRKFAESSGLTLEEKNVILKKLQAIYVKLEALKDVKEQRTAHESGPERAHYHHAHSSRYQPYQRR